MKAMQPECSFNIAKEFTRYPGGRLRIHGPYSGEQFREEVLLPRLNEYERLVIDMTGTLGYGASFLDESFGEVGKTLGVQEAERRLTLIAEDDPDLVDMVWEKIRKASKEAAKP